MQEILIQHEEERIQAMNMIRGLEMGRHGLLVRAREGKRTDAQNKLMWKMLQPFAASVELRGDKYDRDSWKCVFMNMLGHDSPMLPKLNGHGFFAKGYRSSDLSVKEMTALIQAIEAEGIQNGIDYSWLHSDPEWPQ